MFKFLLGLSVGVAGTLGAIYVVNRVRAAKSGPVLGREVQYLSPLSPNPAASDPRTAAARTG